MQERSARDSELRQQSLSTIVEKIRTKIDYPDPIAPEDCADFLAAFYNAQREHLERRQLFGEKRADKHHGERDHHS